MVKKKVCNYEYRGKCFKTKEDRRHYLTWNPIIKKARKDKAPKRTIKMMKDFQNHWVSK